ncbi:MAG: ArsR/SmtB family transcription factor [Planctomycetota bacterium]|jgi:DNA-binding transcriptional ArsR family regulator
MDEIEKLADIFKALSEPTRLRLVNLLSKNDGALCVNAMSHMLGVTQSAVSQHLRILRQTGLVRGERRGQFVHYFIDKKVVEQYKKKVLNTLGDEFVLLQ